MDAQSTESLLRLMSATALRAKILAHNVANQNTPGYRRQDVRFEEKLLQEMRRPRPSLSAVVPELVVDHESPARPDGNNVSLEEELTRSRENRILFEAWAAILQGRMAILSSAINGAR